MALQVAQLTNEKADKDELAEMSRSGEVVEAQVASVRQELQGALQVCRRDSAEIVIVGVLRDHRAPGDCVMTPLVQRCDQAIEVWIIEQNSKKTHGMRLQHHPDKVSSATPRYSRDVADKVTSRATTTVNGRPHGSRGHHNKRR